MGEETVPRTTPGFLIASAAVAVLIGAFAGTLVGFLTHDVVLGIVVFVLAGLASVLEARRAGRGTREGAPPWIGDAAARHHNGGSV